MDILMIIISAFLVILGAYLVSAVAEALQYHYSDTFIACLIALLQTLPEYAFVVHLTLIGEADLAFVSIIGANILLIGLGYPIVIFIAYLSGAKGVKEDKSLDLMRENSVESVFLAISGAYMIFIALKGYINVYDGIILLILFVVYMYIITRLPPEVETEEISGIAKKFLNRKLLSIIILIASVPLIWFSAEEFTNGLVYIKEKYTWISPYLLVVVLAPIVSEMPEKLTAYIGATKNEDMARLGICNFMSSKVNNGTLLFSSMILALIVEYESINVSLSVAHVREFMILAGALTLLGALTTVDRRITLTEGFILIVVYAFLMYSLIEEAYITYSAILMVILGLVILLYAIKDRRFYWISDLKYTLGMIKRKPSASES